MAQGDATKKLEGDIHFIRKSVKADTKLVTNDPTLMEDEFQSLYFTPNKNTNVIIEPPFNPLQLAALVHRNNILSQCVSAMEVNIDGSGYEFVELTVEEDKVTGDDGKGTNAQGGDSRTDVGMGKDDNPGGFIQNVTKDLVRKGTVKKLQPMQAPPPMNLNNQPFQPQSPAGTKPQQAQQALSAASSDPSKTPMAGKVADTNTDGDDVVVDKEKEMLEHFFLEPFPNMSFTTIRRKLRVDLESTGNAYLEVIRNIAGDIVFIRQLESVAMRLVKLDAPTDVEVSVTRGGKEVKAVMPMRERRFCHKIGANLVYYREFGASRKINRKTGAWIEKGAAAEKDSTVLGSEVIHFTVLKDFRTHYGLPRWINQLPSILGSRKAEEFNLEFFDAGGMPPAIIFIQGGALVGGVKEQLQQYLSGKASQKHRAAIVEVMSTSGSLDSSGSVQVKTERFGSSSNDAMFQNYDKACEDHVRKSFRLPPLLTGQVADYSLASAQTSIETAENQVFQPERFNFDETINNTIVKALGAKRYALRSKKMSLADAQAQMGALKDSWYLIQGEDYIKNVNEITGLQLTYSAEAEAANKPPQQPGMGGDPMGGDPNDPNAMGDGSDGGFGDPGGAPPSGYSDPQNMGTPPTPVGMNDTNNGQGYGDAPYVGQGPNMSQKSEKVRKSPTQLIKLAQDWSIAVGLVTGDLPEIEKSSILLEVDALVNEDRAFFDKVIVNKVFKTSADPDAVALLESCK